MALENYIEMRDLVDDPDFLLQQALERALEARHPGRFVPHYSMVTFMRIPYSLALERSNVQRGILTEATRGLDSLDGVDWTAVDEEVEQIGRASRRDRVWQYVSIQGGAVTLK